MPVLDGLEATRPRCRRHGRGPPLLILTTFDDDDVLWGAVEAGAQGFLLKDTPADDLIRAIRTVAAGGSWLDPAGHSSAVAHVAGRAAVVAAPNRLGSSASPSERWKCSP